MTPGARTVLFILCCSGLQAAPAAVFKPGISFPTLAGPLASITGDFNQDGRVDLVVSNTAVGSVSVFLGVGDGTFRPRVDYGVAGCQVGQVITGDFNRDGKLDLLGTCTLTTTIFVLPGKGDGTFGAPIFSKAPLPVVSGFLENFVEPLTTADVNGDGILDLALIIQTIPSVGLATPGAVGQTVIMTGNGDGTFGHSTPLNIAPAGTETYSVQLADVNGDGKADIVGVAFNYTSAGLTNPLTAFLFVALGDGAGGFRLTNFYPLTHLPQTGMMLADVNGDGKTDVVFAGLSIAAILSASTTDLSGVGVFLGDGKGAFTLGYSTVDSQTIQNQATIGASLAPVFNSKGPDIIGVMYYSSLTSSHAITGALVVRPNNGDGTFGPAQTLLGPSSTLPFSIAVADFNGDGSPDVVAFEFNVDLFTLLFGNVNVLLNQIDLIGQSIATFPPATASVLLNTTVANTFTNANSASFRAGGLAASSIVSAFGTGLASTTLSAPGLPLPLTIGGTSVVVIDSQGVARPAPLFYVSPTQVNYVIPDGTALNTATVSITTQSGTSTAKQSIVGVAPGIFNAGGLAAAQIFTYNGSAIPVITSTIASDAQGKLIPAPIDVGTGTTEVFLILYGTGIRNRQSSATATIGSTTVPTAYAGAQGIFVGEDQINILLPQSLRGLGLTTVAISADGQSSNLVQVEIK